MNRLSRKILVLAVLLFSPCSVLATTRTVTNLNDSGAGSLRQAILDSASGDTINFAVTGTIGLTSGELQINHDLTITGPGAANLTITRSSASFFRIFYFDNGTWNVSGLTISNGHDTAAGGGIYNGNGNLTVSDCTFTSNYADNLGGAIYIYPSASLTVNNCTFTGNISQAGAISILGNLMVTNCTFNNNGVAGTTTAGGAIHCVNGPVTVTNCTFSNNTATKGGAIYSIGDLTVQSCTFSGNTAADRGNSIVITGSAVLYLGNTILQSSGANLFVDNDGSSASSMGYNLSSDNGSGFLTGTADQINTNALLDPYGLQDNGGPTRTIALTQYSPAIDQGKAPLGSVTDQRGQPRTIDNPDVFPAVGGDGTDIGAYESPADPVQWAATLVVTTTDDHDDGVAGVRDCTLREAIQRANARPGPNTIVFAPNVTGMIPLQTGLGELVISDASNISGPGARILAVSGNEAHRVFNFGAGTSTVSGLTIRDGWNAGSSGGVTRLGGGIYNQATLTLSDCMLTNNFVQGGNNNDGLGGAGGSAFGGGVYNAGSLTLDRCAFYRDNSGNVAGGGGGSSASGIGRHGGAGGDGAGGAVYNAAGATLAVKNSTFNGNSCGGGSGGNSSLNTGGNGGRGLGGAICNLGTMVVSATTIDGNFGTGAFGGAGSHGANGANGIGIGGLASVAGSNSTVRNAISAGNVGNNGGGSDVNGAFTSTGYNLIGIGDFSTGFNASGDQVGTTAAPIDPRLGPLQNNGGFTDTMALMTNSLAIDQGKSFGLFTDQRGHERPFDAANISNASGGDGSDIGAFELGGTLVPIKAVSRKTHGAAGSFDITLPLTGPIGVECRSGGATGDYQIVVTFAAPVTVTGNPQAQIASGIGQIGTGGTSNGGIVSVNGAIVTVPLTNVVNAQRITLTLFGASDGANTNNVSVPIGFLLGDTSGNGSVNATDVSQTKTKSGQAVDATNFREDVNVNGAINSSDVSAVKLKSGTALP